MSLPVNIEEYQLYLFADVEEMRRKRLPVGMVDRLLRLRAIYTYWRNFPEKSTRELVTDERQMYPEVKEREAYDDIRIIKMLMGNLEAESKEWHRLVFNRRTDEVYKLAIQRKDLRTAEKANADYAKFNRVGELDPVPIDYDSITPHVIEPSSDPSTIGINSSKDWRELKDKMLKKYRADAVEADFVELNDNDNSQ